ncbi:MAG: hypothetical protein DWQ11_12195 [Proteobacteria bacterium]|nr:MAG: hypothetical protein DWQ11_12195 [Pseudomonadota bacterium]
MNDRRDFLNTCAIGAAALMAPAGLMAAPLRATPSRATFNTLVDEAFQCALGGGNTLALTLEAVLDGPHSPGLEQFDLVLRNSGGSALPAAAYPLYHPRTGAMLVHLTPSDSTPGRYRAQFGLFA